VLQSLRSSAKYIFWFILITFVGGFLLAETSGLLGRGVTPNTTVASVNGRDVPYDLYARVLQNAEQQQSERIGRALTLDERNQVERQAFDQMVAEILLEQEYKRRGIVVSDDEIRQAARLNPPPELLRNAELQTEGQFDPAKYQRFLASPAARQGGLLLQLESYYRSEIPKQKLFEQLASSVYVTDARLWSIYQDQHDSARVSFVALRPESVPDSAVKVTDAELRSYFQAHTEEFERPGRAAVSILSIPRVVSAADSAAVRARLLALRAEIAGATDQAAKFAEVARRESHDSISAANGGSLGGGRRGRFVPAFENAAYALKPGELSQPVLTQFGYHLIRVDSRTGDSLNLRHILLRVEQSDSTASRVDRRADSLTSIAGSSENPAAFDSAAKRLGIPVVRATAIEGDPLTVNGRYVPSVSAWAFGGARAGESSELFDGEDGYYLARLDTLVEGGKPAFDAVKEDVRRRVVQKKKIERLLPQARQLASAAATSSLESAAKSRGLTVEQSPPFTRVMPVPGLGSLNEAVGAAFSLPVGAVSAPISTDDGVYVLRVDRRVNADRAAFEAQKQAQRTQVMGGLRQQRVRDYLENLRKTADIEDNRKQINAAARSAV
jgi:peptidyl-prolyl cis-trans isomerase D